MAYYVNTNLSLNKKTFLCPVCRTKGDPLSSPSIAYCIRNRALHLYHHTQCQIIIDIEYCCFLCRRYAYPEHTIQINLNERTASMLLCSEECYSKAKYGLVSRLSKRGYEAVSDNSIVDNSTLSEEQWFNSLWSGDSSPISQKDS